MSLCVGVVLLVLSDLGVVDCQLDDFVGLELSGFEYCVNIFGVCGRVGVVSPPWVDIAPARQCIGFRAELSGSVVDDEVVHGQLFRPSCLTSVEYLGGREVLEVAVVGEYLDGVWRSFKVLPERIETSNNGQ